MGSEVQEEVSGSDRQVDSSALLFTCSMTHTMSLLFFLFAKQVVVPQAGQECCKGDR